MSRCLATSAAAQEIPVFEHERDMYVSPGQSGSIWSGPLLLRYEDTMTDSPLVEAIDRDLNRDRIPFEIPGASKIQILRLGAGADGSILVGGNAFSRDSRRAGFIAWITPDRKGRTLIQTEPFRPQTVVMSSDGVIWAAGHLWDGVDGRHNTFNIIRRYDKTGILLSTLNVKNAICDPRLMGDGDADSASRLLASKDRVGWLTSGYEYIEFSLDGEIRDRFAGPHGPEITGLSGWGMSQDNQIVLDMEKGSNSYVVVLDRRTRTWIPLPIPGHKTPGWVQIIGFDGTTLIVFDQGTVERYKPAGNTR